MRRALITGVTGQHASFLAELQREVPSVNRILWVLGWPVRAYIRYVPWQRGKGFLAQHLLAPLLPNRTFEAELPTGARIELRCGESLGLHTILQGLFERGELEFMASAVDRGSLVLDVGANVGLFTVALARVVGEDGSVWAFEPVPDNVSRLAKNIEKNGLTNVRIFEMALGSIEGHVDMHVAEDAAFSSMVRVQRRHTAMRSVKVRLGRLDQVWQEGGRPKVAAIKIDVEGAELEVLRGGTQLVRACRPLILAEANTRACLRELNRWLTPFGYRCYQPRTFSRWNYVFSAQWTR